MTDTKALREKIEAKGLKLKAVAEKLGITPYSVSYTHLTLPTICSV